MHLFLSDLHLGREPVSTSREAEQDAVELLRFYEKALADGGGLFLVGDIFHAYIEYKHLIPKGGTRLLGMLATLTDRGTPVTCLAGNRDPWHIDYFEKELGIRSVRRSLTTRLSGRLTYVSHGDGELVSSPFLTRLRAFARHPRVASLYRMAFPGDTALGFAKWFSKTFGTDGTSDSEAEKILVARAFEHLRTTKHDLVVHGHTHEPRLIERSAGTYVNPGHWFADRTFARLTHEGPALFRWSAGRAIPLNLQSPD